MPDTLQPTVLIPLGSTVATALKTALREPLESRILVSHALQLSRTQLITQSERILTAAETEAINVLFQRRLAGEPIAYIIGEREFYGLMLHTTPAVLIPRPETELLVELALDCLPHQGRVLDLGTGSGAIAIAIAQVRHDAAVTAVDVSAEALAVARRNAARHHASITFMKSNWYEALSGQQFNIIVANPPYIEKGDLHLAQGDLRFEPIDALTDHADGLSALRIIVDGASQHLLPGGWLLMEHGYNQAAAVRALLSACGFMQVQSWTDLAGIERTTGGQLSIPPASAALDQQ